MHNQYIYLVPDQVSFENIIVPAMIHFAKTIDEYDLYKKLPHLTMLAYLIILVSILWILERLFANTFVTIIALISWAFYANTLHNDRGLGLYVLIILLILKKIITIFNGREKTAQITTSIYGSIPKTTYLDRNTVIILVFIAVLILTSYLPPGHHTQFIGVVVAPLIFIVVASNLGGHSNAMYYYGTLFTFIGLLVYQPFREGLAEVIQNMLDSNKWNFPGEGTHRVDTGTDTITVRMAQTTKTYLPRIDDYTQVSWAEFVALFRILPILEWPFHVFWYVTPPLVNLTWVSNEISRLCIFTGLSCMHAYFAIEDFLGVDAIVEGTISASTPASGKSGPPVKKGTRYILTSHWNWVIATNLIWALITRGWLRLISLILGMIVAYIFWAVIGKYQYIGIGEESSGRWTRYGFELLKKIDMYGRSPRLAFLHGLCITQMIAYTFGVYWIIVIPVSIFLAWKIDNEVYTLRMIALLAADPGTLMVSMKERPFVIPEAGILVGNDTSTPATIATGNPGAIVIEPDRNNHAGRDYVMGPVTRIEDRITRKRNIITEPIEVVGPTTEPRRYLEMEDPGETRAKFQAVIDRLKAQGFEVHKL